MNMIIIHQNISSVQSLVFETVSSLQNKHLSSGINENKNLEIWR